jgi:hypothetical protein
LASLVLQRRARVVRAAPTKRPLGDGAPAIAQAETSHNDIAFPRPSAALRADSRKLTGGVYPNDARSGSRRRLFSVARLRGARAGLSLSLSNPNFFPTTK